MPVMNDDEIDADEYVEVDGESTSKTWIDTVVEIAVGIALVAILGGVLTAIGFVVVRILMWLFAELF